MINNVTLIGRLTRDAELRYTPSNIATAQFNIACNRNFKNANDEYDVDIKIFTFECGMEFTQEIEISKGEIIKNVCYEYDDYQWEFPFSNLGG